jgi:lactoylglutathione lyase
MSLGAQISGLGHIGICVHDMARTRAFYERLGFEWAWGPAGPEPVAAMTHPSGLELNFILNARDAKAPNILMDVPEKHAGITHIALQIKDVAAAKAALTASGIAISGTRGAAALFVRDPDGNVIELAAD